MKIIDILTTQNNFSQKRKDSNELLRAFIVCLTFLCLTIPAYSQSDSLIKYLEIAASKNPFVLQRFAEYQAALQKVPQAGSLSDPELSLGVFLKPMELISGNQVADIRLMQMFPWFGVLRSAKDEMSMMANSKYELFRDAKLQVNFDVQKTWYELHKIRKEESISDRNLEILKTIERIAIVKFRTAPSGNSGSKSSNLGMSTTSSQSGLTGVSGMSSMGSEQGSSGGSGSGSSQTSAQGQLTSMNSSSNNTSLADLYRIQIETGDLENKIAGLKNQENTILARFNSYLNRVPLSHVFTGKLLNSDSLGLTVESVSDTILERNPMLTMLGFEIQSLDARKKMVSAMGFPMIGFGINYSLINKNEMSASPMNGNDMIMPMVTFTLPIYRKKYNAMKNETDLLKSAASQNYQATANSLNNEYYQAVQLFEDAKRRVKLYENQYQLASKSFDLAIKSFSTSATELTDVLRIYQQTLDYEIKQVEAVTDLNISVAWLNRIMAYTLIK